MQLLIIFIIYSHCRQISTLYHLKRNEQCLTFIKLYERKYNLLINILKNNMSNLVWGLDIY